MNSPFSLLLDLVPLTASKGTEYLHVTLSLSFDLSVFGFGTFIIKYSCIHFNHYFKKYFYKTIAHAACFAYNIGEGQARRAGAKKGKAFS